MSNLTPIFGTHALTPARENWRKRADVYSDTRWGRLMISRCRKKALSGGSEPFDVEVIPGLNARLYPSANRCEKRAFAGVQVWDGVERKALKTAIETNTDEDFVFLDVGANVGLYSLFVNAYAKAANINTRIIAVEPGMETCARLEANIHANDAPVQIIRAAISDVPGTGHLGGGETNRGEAKLQGPLESSGQNGETVIIDTLARICRTHGITHINAMKLDIEGHDLKALTGFFEDAPERLHPALLILETGREQTSPLIELCAAHDYIVTERPGINSILVKKTHVKT